MRSVGMKFALLFLLLMMGGGCSGDSPASVPTGSVEMRIDWSSSAKPEGIAHEKILSAAQSVQVLVTGPGITTPIAQCAGRTSGGTQVITLQNIPTGDNLFTLTLFNQSSCLGSKVDGAAASLNVVANQVNPLTVTFTGQMVFTVEVTPPATTIAINGQTAFTATAKNADGEVLSGKTVSWSSSKPNVASIDSNGSAKGLADGSTIITALIEGQSGTAQLNVGSATTDLCTVQGTPPPIPDISLQQILNGGSLSSPVHITHAGDGSGRLFVVEQGGTIRMVTGGALQSGLFLDLRDPVLFDNEMGLLSLAFHPNFATNGLFYVNYSTDRLLDGNQERRSVISEFKVGATPAATAASERILLKIVHPNNYHNGGQLAFGPEPQPYLYFGMGDDGESYAAQDLTSLLGKVLRIDVDHKDAGLEYSIPADNPSWGVSGARREIWAHGFRNPWRFSFDPVTGFHYLADVGENAVEEIDIIRKGFNYGWDQIEGNQCSPVNPSCNLASGTPPILVHPHPSFQAIIGGVVYRGSQLPSLCGVYLYGDFGTGKIRGLRYDGSTVTDQRDLASLASLTSFGEDDNHEVYAVSYGGALYKVSAP